MYAIPVFALLPIPFAKRKIGYRITATITGIVAVLSGFLYNSPAPLNLSSTGGDTINVSFIDESGKEMSVTLNASDELDVLKKAKSRFDSREPVESKEDAERLLEKNFSTKMLNDKCGYLILNAEMTDNDIQDNIAYLMGNHK